MTITCMAVSVAAALLGLILGALALVAWIHRNDDPLLFPEESGLGGEFRSVGDHHVCGKRKPDGALSRHQMEIRMQANRQLGRSLTHGLEVRPQESLHWWDCDSMLGSDSVTEGMVRRSMRNAVWYRPKRKGSK